MNLYYWSRLVAIGLAAATVGSCSSSTEPFDLGPVPPGAFTTDATGYVAHRIPHEVRYRFQVVTRFENRGTATLYLGRCFPDSPQPLFGIEGVNGTGDGYVQTWGCVGHNRQFAIHPGDIRIDTLVVEGPNMFQGYSNIPIDGATNGDFRLYFDVRTAPGDGAPPAADSLRLSNPFRVRTSEAPPP